MSAIDLAELRRMVNRAPVFDEGTDLQVVPKRIMLALLDRIESLEAEAKSARDLIAAIADELTPGRRDKDLVIAARDRAEARLARVEALHRQSDVLSDGTTICVLTGHQWPCDTIRAVAADEQEAGR